MNVDDGFDTLHRLRDGQAPPTPDQRAAARRRLLAQVRAGTPARPDVSHPPAEPTWAVPPPPSATAVSRPPWRRRLAPLVAAVVVVAVLATVVVWVGSSVVGPPLPLIDRALPGLDVDVPEVPVPLDVHRGIDPTGDPQLLADGVSVEVVAPAVPGRWPVVLLLTDTMPHEDYEPFARALAEHGVVVHLLRTSSGVRTVTTRMVEDTLTTIACGLQHTTATTWRHGGVAETTTVVAFGTDAPIAILAALRADEVDASPCTITGSGVVPAAVVALSSGLTGCLHTTCTSGEDADASALDPFAHLAAAPELPIHFLLPGHGDIAHDGLERAGQLADGLGEAGHEVEWTTFDGSSPGDLYLDGGRARDAVVARIVEIVRG